METKYQQLSEKECNKSLHAIEDALYVIGGKWKLRIIIGLLDKPKRFNALQRTVKGISSKVLSNELKNLELNGFVKRTVYAEKTPVVVEYSLTAYSETLYEVLDALTNWGLMHRERLKNTEA